MDDLPESPRELGHLIPPDHGPGADRARQRLRTAMVAERRRVRREWFLVRSLLVGMAIFSVWTIAPGGSGGGDRPLVGLAEATAALQPPEMGPDDEWYVREERSQRILLIDRARVEPTEVEVVVSTVAETWVNATASTVRQRLVSQIESLSPDDRAAMDLVEQSQTLPLGRFETEPAEVAYPGVHPMWAGGPEAVLAELTRAAGDHGDVRLQRLAVLKAAATLMQQHGADPVKRGIVLLTIASIPGIEVDMGDLLSVRYQYVVGDVAQEVRYDFDRTDGSLVGESISTLATPTSDAILLSRSQYEARLAIDESAGS
ncbi:MAG: hypothetical protein ACFCVC_14625 [Acidimicrobiia bacterium]